MIRLVDAEGKNYPITAYDRKNFITLPIPVELSVASSDLPSQTIPGKVLFETKTAKTYIQTGWLGQRTDSFTIGNNPVSPDKPMEIPIDKIPENGIPAIARRFINNQYDEPKEVTIFPAS